ncbi:hypothetical protein HELRODRAFT_185005 [Helobdella robusta]|uniref:Dihydrolipoamide acetyltransferase component of pyruvate dehydrogenase complex n=1 Tax=Helobdella robusta TaxID=6412 RepID=T1FM96_HELRO|nr:hypothetical protein HELRODRAFT_185005 [Helobdella robusta]ESO02627.1 hypothetical protein HELRODRAFT_185005 [Helobdella robusta]
MVKCRTTPRPSLNGVFLIPTTNHILLPHKSYSVKTEKSPTKIVQFKLSDIGEGIREVLLKEWFITEGDKVAQFDSICEVQSDKASVTITSRYDGIVRKLYHAVDDTALVGQPLVDIEVEGNLEGLSTNDNITSSSSSSSSDSDDDVIEAKDGLKKEERKVIATPAVRHLASVKKVDLYKVTGSGKHGRILKEDIFAYLKSLETAAIEVNPPSTTTTKQPLPPPTTASISLPTSTTSVTRPDPVLPLISRSVEAPKDRVEVISGMKKAMVASMTAANSVPHFSLCDEVNVSELVHMKPFMKETARKYGVKFSYTSLFVKAASLALLHYPILNSSVDEECKNVIYKGSHNIGVAMDSPNGLIVPNIKNVGQLNVLEVASELSRLMQLAASGKLGLADLTGGTFTLSNVGMIGGTYTKPVIFVPEVVIGALGSITKVPRYDGEGKVVPAHVMNISWSADHRVIDGATLARFSNLWKSYLENPVSFLLHLR